jgi:hypothetical protein
MEVEIREAARAVCNLRVIKGKANSVSGKFSAADSANIFTIEPLRGL